MARNDEQLDLLPKQNQNAAAAPAATASQAALTSQAPAASNTPASPTLYGGAYDQQIDAAYKAVTVRAPFQYNLDGDAMFDSYKRLYTQNAKRAMKDTIGQAAAYTGGYNNTYGQAVGQQMYDETMRHLDDKALELEQRAYGRWQDEGDRLLQQYQLLNQMGATEQATRENAYQKLAQAIMTAGHIPSEAELQAAGMNSETANKYLMAWMTANPDAAYMMGALNPAQYYQITGKNPNGYVDPNAAAAGGGGGGYSGGGKSYPDAQGLSKEEIMNIQRQLGVKVDGIWGDETQAAYNAAPKQGQGNTTGTAGTQGNKYDVVPLNLRPLVDTAEARIGNTVYKNAAPTDNYFDPYKWYPR